MFYFIILKSNLRRLGILGMIFITPKISKTLKFFVVNVAFYGYPILVNDYD